MRCLGGVLVTISNHAQIGPFFSTRKSSSKSIARQAIIDESAKRKMTLNLPPLVPFGSRQWPTLVTPGPGAKTLADLP